MYKFRDGDVLLTADDVTCPPPPPQKTPEYSTNGVLSTSPAVISLFDDQLFLLVSLWFSATVWKQDLAQTSVFISVSATFVFAAYFKTMLSSSCKFKLFLIY